MRTLIQFKQFVDGLSECDGTNAKIKYISEYKDNDLVKLYLQKTYDPYITYGVKKVPATKKVNTDEPDLTFLEILDKLEKRELSGNAANDVLKSFKEHCNAHEIADIVDKIIKKDLRCGIGAKSINKAIPGLINVFEIALCERVDEKTTIPARGNIQVKLDGVRNIAIVDTINKKITHYSRAGIVVDVFDGVFDELFDLAKELIDYKFMDFDSGVVVFDGEVCGNTWNTTMEAKAKKNINEKAISELKYHIFDFMSYEFWKDKSVTVTNSQITEILLNILKGYEKLRFPETLRYNNHEEATEFYINCVARGLEGAVIKKLGSLYSFKKSNNWLKWKPELDFDGEIIDIVEGDGQFKNSCGAIVVSGITENDEKFFTSCGSGFSAEDRATFWNNRLDLIGTTVEIKGQALTKPDKNGVYSIQFPVFKRLRTDK